jgi:hypothetical protein
MYLDTSREELTNSLTEAGLNVVACQKLEPLEGKTFNTAAVDVACAKMDMTYFIRNQHGQMELS